MARTCCLSATRGASASSSGPTTYAPGNASHPGHSQPLLGDSRTGPRRGDSLSAAATTSSASLRSFHAPERSFAIVSALTLSRSKSTRGISSSTAAPPPPWPPPPPPPSGAPPPPHEAECLKKREAAGGAGAPLNLAASAASCLRVTCHREAELGAGVDTSWTASSAWRGRVVGWWWAGHLAHVGEEGRLEEGGADSGAQRDHQLVRRLAHRRIARVEGRDLHSGEISAESGASLLLSRENKRRPRSSRRRKRRGRAWRRPRGWRWRRRGTRRRPSGSCATERPPAVWSHPSYHCMMTVESPAPNRRTHCTRRLV